MNATNERWAEPELHRLQGEALDRADAEPELVEACFNRAIASARALGAPAWERPATASLIDLLRRQGRGAEADEMLSAANHGLRGFSDDSEARARRERLHQTMA